MHAPQVARNVSVVLALVAPGFAQNLLYPSPVYANDGGNGPDVALHDVDRDGYLDAITTSVFTSEVLILRGKQNGAFALVPQRFAVSAYPSRIALGDLNGDSIDDVAVSCASGSIEVLLGRVRGGLHAPVTTTTLGVPVYLSLGDADADGVLDAATSDGTFSATNALFWRGRGDGTFHTPVSVPMSGQPNEVKLADVDGDPWLDIAALIVSGGAHRIAVRRGLGQGNFASEVSSVLPYAWRSLELRDLDGDHHAEALVSARDTSIASYPGKLLVLPGIGDGTFGAASVYDVVAEPTDVALADLDEDGVLDVCVPHAAAVLPVHAISFLRGLGAGVLAPEQLIDAAGYGGALAIGDLEHDGDLDLVCALSEGRGAFTVVRALSDGVFEVGGTTLATSEPSSGLAAGDIDGDGFPDLATTVLPNLIDVRLGDGAGGFQALPPIASAITPSLVVLNDFNGDGRADLATSGRTSAADPSGVLEVRLATTQGTFAAPQSYAVGPRPSALALGDVTHDGRADLVSSHYGSPTAVILHARANGTFEPLPAVALGAPNDYVVDLAVADCDGDTRKDLVALLGGARASIVLAGPGNTFQAPLFLTLPSDGFAVAAGRLDADAFVDVAFACYPSHSIRVFHGAGDGSFIAGADIDTVESPSDIAIADLNLNGRPDLAITGQEGTTLWIFTGDGLGGFDPPRGFGVGFVPSSIVVADFDRDGKPDVATNNPGDRTLSVLLHL